MSYLDRFCPKCDTPIDPDKHTFNGTYKQDHNPNTPGIPPERVTIKTYRCPECEYSPIDEMTN